MKKIYLKTVLFLFATTLILTACSKDDDKDPNTDVISNGEFKDPRDGKVYKTVKIGNQTWFAENLNFDLEGSYDNCYDKKEENCTKYGKLYGSIGAKKAIPEGWHLPSKAEYEALINAYGGAENAKKALLAGGKSGFEILKSGAIGEGTSYGLGESAHFWSASLDDDGKIITLAVESDEEKVLFNHVSIGYKFSVRCIKDN